jgi:hypothetical protein
VVTFDLAYRIAKSKAYRRLSLGAFPDVSLEAARDRGYQLTRAARDGRDLLAQEAQAITAKAARVTVGHLADEYVARRAGCALPSKSSVGLSAQSLQLQTVLPTICGDETFASCWMRVPTLALRGKLNSVGCV